MSRNGDSPPLRRGAKYTILAAHETDIEKGNGMAGLNETPSGDRVRLAFFGRRNAGKSSLINALTGQEVAIVSDVPGAKRKVPL